MMHKKTATVISLAALAAAQISVSSQCQAGITALTSNEEASRCLAINQLSNILLTKSDASIINPINTWLVAFCGAPECSPETLDTVATSLANACESDLGSLGLSPDQVQLVIPYIKQYFSTAKQVICLADTSEDAFCATSLAHDVEDAIGQPLSLNTLVGAYTSGSSPVSSNITCTKCTQGELAILSQQTQLDTLFNIQGPVATACGEEFAATTTMPAGIVVGTGTAVPKGNGENNNDGPDGASTLAIAGSLVAVAGAVLLGLLA